MPHDPILWAGGVQGNPNTCKSALVRLAAIAQSMLCIPREALAEYDMAYHHDGQDSPPAREASSSPDLTSGTQQAPDAAADNGSSAGNGCSTSQGLSWSVCHPQAFLLGQQLLPQVSNWEPWLACRFISMYTSWLCCLVEADLIVPATSMYCDSLV